MKHLLFTVYDEKAEVFLPPFFVPTIGLATRAFSDCVNTPDHQFGKHPADYTLFQLGEFYDHDASFVETNKKSLGNGVEYVGIPPTNSQGTAHHGPSNTPIQPDQTG